MGYNRGENVRESDAQIQSLVGQASCRYENEYAFGFLGVLDVVMDEEVLQPRPNPLQCCLEWRIHINRCKEGCGEHLQGMRVCGHSRNQTASK